MASARYDAVLRHLRRVVHAPDGALTDGELLRRWLARRDEAAFEALLWRHGPAVLAVCRRLLPRPQDAEDAFQATFLTLVRKGGSVGRRDAVGWRGAHRPKPGAAPRKFSTSWAAHWRRPGYCRHSAPWRPWSGWRRRRPGGSSANSPPATRRPA